MRQKKEENMRTNFLLKEIKRKMVAVNRNASIITLRFFSAAFLKILVPTFFYHSLHSMDFTIQILTSFSNGICSRIYLHRKLGSLYYLHFTKSSQEKIRRNGIFQGKKV